MYNLPSRRRRKSVVVRPNLIPILDAVFIFIFFLLMSANFVQIFEINSNVPIVSDQEPPKKKKPPLALTLKIKHNGIEIFTGIPSTLLRRIDSDPTGEYDLETLHQTLVRIKRRNVREKSAILEPATTVSYEKLVTIMDAIRMMKNTDPDLYSKNKDGINIKVNELFSDIIFGNIQS